MPFAFPTVKTAFGSGAALGMSDPALIGPGRIGLTVITPSIPVTEGDSVCAEEKTEDKTRSARIIRRVELCDTGCAGLRKIAHPRSPRSNPSFRGRISITLTSPNRVKIFARKMAAKMFRFDIRGTGSVPSDEINGTRKSSSLQSSGISSEFGSIEVRDPSAEMTSMRTPISPTGNKAKTQVELQHTVGAAQSDSGDNLFYS